MSRPRSGLRLGSWVAVAASVVAISAGHYATSMHALVLHEVFTRLYYLPIVWAALAGGTVAGVATVLFATALYLPHVVVGWHAWPAVQVGQYGEVVVFLLMAVVSGQIGARLREERDRAQAASEQRAEALQRLESSLEERLQVDRWVTTGQLATGMAHELRNPLGAARGALDIVEQGTSQREQHDEFFGIARRSIDEASRLVQDLLDFARPSPPADMVVDLREVLQQAYRLTTGALAARDVSVEMSLGGEPAFVAVDVAQMQRAMVTLLLEAPQMIDTRHVEAAVSREGGRSVVTIRLRGVGDRVDRVDSLFEPFSDARVGHGLTLAIAKRLVENQGGTLRAGPCPEGVLLTLSLPTAAPDQPHRPGVERVSLAPQSNEVVTPHDSRGVGPSPV